MILLSRAEIEELIDLPTAADAIVQAFRDTAAGLVRLPPVGHLPFPEAGADCHIKYGHVVGAPHFVIKVATGFPGNAERGGATGNGLVLVMSAQTGAVQAMLHDEMALTDIRTGLGGAIATRALARADAQRVIVLGTGVQARRQIEAHVALLGDHLEFEVWGRDLARASAVRRQLEAICDVRPTAALEHAVRRADIVITTTGATGPLVPNDWIQRGTHITAIGADAPGKQELDTALVQRADVRAVDLARQCLDHGELQTASREGLLDVSDVVELGHLLDDPALGRTEDDQITLADLTGIAAQDIAMADTVLSAWHAQNTDR